MYGAEKKKGTEGFTEKTVAAPKRVAGSIGQVE